MATPCILMETHDKVTGLLVKLIELRLALGHRQYQVMIKPRQFAPIIREHRDIDHAIKDYVMTIASEAASFGSEELQEDLENFPRYHSREVGDIAQPQLPAIPA